MASTVDELMIVTVGRAVAMSVRVIVAVAGARRQMMIGAERAVRDERKRRHDRQTVAKRLHSNWAKQITRAPE